MNVSKIYKEHFWGLIETYIGDGCKIKDHIKNIFELADLDNKCALLLALDDSYGIHNLTQFVRSKGFHKRVVHKKVDLKLYYGNVEFEKHEEFRFTPGEKATICKIFEVVQEIPENDWLKMEKKVARVERSAAAPPKQSVSGQVGDQSLDSEREIDRIREAIGKSAMLSEVFAESDPNFLENISIEIKLNESREIVGTIHCPSLACPKVCTFKKLFDKRSLRQSKGYWSVYNFARHLATHYRKNSETDQQLAVETPAKKARTGTKKARNGGKTTGEGQERGGPDTEPQAHLFEPNSVPTTSPGSSREASPVPPLQTTPENTSEVTENNSLDNSSVVDTNDQCIDRLEEEKDSSDILENELSMDENVFPEFTYPTKVTLLNSKDDSGIIDMDDSQISTDSSIIPDSDKDLTTLSTVPFNNY
ncbi:hypothetical protein QAD02_013113 [Eretmocerus hayati]|uniref:Uncharacterized protein n=1 Tax=Eretmocerus hayati TaxID=131215 RepID=A0ACC2P2N8_9HYME|nr:hypothetical protein QAD02_013113 [Eretmocerus hayati]